MITARCIRCCRALLVGALILGVLHATAQEDSTALYRKIHDYSQKRKVTRWIYEGIFTEPDTGGPEPAPNTPQRRSRQAERYAGRVIRAVHITVLDPFGYSVDDTAKAPTVWIQRAGNSLHRTTRNFIVHDLLLFEEGDTVDALTVTESERLLRASPVVSDAHITVRAVGRDSADVHVIVHDRWNYDVSGEGGFTSFSATARDRNFLGLGQELEQNVVHGIGFGQPELSGKHSVYNIRNSYIGSTLYYGTSSTRDQLGVALSRAFYSPLTRYAGGFSVGKIWTRTPMLDTLGGSIGTTRLDPIALDTWVGRSFRFAKDGTDPGRSANITTALRYYQTRYAIRPSFLEDSLRVNSENSAWLMSTGFGVRQYYKERYLYRFGSSEDVSEGLLLTATSGVDKTEVMPWRMYAGVSLSRGKHYAKFGYASASLAYGTYWRKGEVDGATLRIDLLYFSDLASLGHWHFRQFVRANVVGGFSKRPFELLTLNGTQFYGFASDQVAGRHKELLRFETVAYAPYNILGFRFAPILLYGMATIGYEGAPYFTGRIHHAITLGLLVRNENLLVSTFEVSLGIYPFIPERGGMLFDPGSVSSFSVSAPDFTFSQPAVVDYY